MADRNKETVWLTVTRQQIALPSVYSTDGGSKRGKKKTFWNMMLSAQHGVKRANRKTTQHGVKRANRKTTQHGVKRANRKTTARREAGKPEDHGTQDCGQLDPHGRHIGCRRFLLSRGRPVPHELRINDNGFSRYPSVNHSSKRINPNANLLLSWCFTSTEAVRLIRDGRMK